MGMGDDIMFTAEVRQHVNDYDYSAVIAPVDEWGCVAWSSVYENNPHMTKHLSNSDLTLPIKPRPYSDGWHVDPIHGPYHKLKAYYPEPGEIYFSHRELSHSFNVIKQMNIGNFVTIEPNTKTDTYVNNRDWGFDKWQSVVDARPDLTFVQLGDKQSRSLERVARVVTDNVRQAFAMIYSASLHVGNEGGLVHAAAASHIPSVVVFGGLSAPWATGYKMNTNLYVDGPESPCGRKTECQHCRDALDSITVDDVLEGIKNHAN